MPNWKSYESSVRLLSAILAAHPDLRLNYQEVSRCFGGDCTVSAIENRFRRIKTDAKSIKEALAKGIDPMTLPVEGGRVGDATADGSKQISKYYGDCTPNSLDHRFRPIKKQAQEMRAAFRNGGGIAEKYGEDVTAKAVSTRFERLKKEPHWLGNGGAMSTANKSTAAPKSTPRKQKTKKMNVDGDDGNASDDSEEFQNKKPSPNKGPLNKTQGGRVQKSPSKKKTVNAAHIEIEDDEVEQYPVKAEIHSGFQNNGYGYGFENDDMDEEGEAFYESPQFHDEV